MPITHSSDPMAMTDDSKYSRQLYTSLGVGRSSTARKVIVAARTESTNSQCRIWVGGKGV